MEFDSPYLTEQIIAYIGNKRKLLPLIFRAMQKLEIEIRGGLKFLDAFAGSGVVSRFAKSLGFEVYSNDWEFYSFVINSAYLLINKSEIGELFGSEEDFKNLLKKINSLPPPADENLFIAKFYAPKGFDLDKSDYKTERLFYTRENAIEIDKIRNFIDQNYPKICADGNLDKRFALLTALLIYEGATHTNTSGVFKAFHKEFGGHGKDALKRITAKIGLHEPVLINSDFPCHVFQENANDLAKKIGPVDIAYLDPPYNQHQYGSNYFMLNTIANWDKIAPGLELGADGILKEKAGIRHDWVETRSPYCYRLDAEKSFADLIENLRAKYILVSYSTDGIIPFEKMCEICMKKGRLSVVTNEYTTYRGGKQSNKRQNTDIEFILCIDTAKKSDSESRGKILEIFTRKKLSILFRQKFSREKLLAFPEKIILNENSLTVILSSSKKIEIQGQNFFTLTEPQLTGVLSQKDAAELYSILAPCVCSTKEEELSCLIAISKKVGLGQKKLIKAIPHTLKKLASKKNRAVFYKWLSKIEELAQEYPEIYAFIADDLQKVAQIAETRFAT